MRVLLEAGAQPVLGIVRVQSRGDLLHQLGVQLVELLRLGGAGPAVRVRVTVRVGAGVGVGVRVGVTVTVSRVTVTVRVHLPLAPVPETSTLPVSRSMRTSHHSGWLSKIGLVEPPT